MKDQKIKPSATKKKAVAVTLDPAVIEKLRSFAAESERSVSWTANRLLAEALGLRPKKGDS